MHKSPLARRRRRARSVREPTPSLLHDRARVPAMVQAEAAEVRRRFPGFVAETNATGEVGLALARLAALAFGPSGTPTSRPPPAWVEADFVPPEGADEAQAAYFLKEIPAGPCSIPPRGARPWPESTRPPTSAFFRCLKELGPGWIERASASQGRRQAQRRDDGFVFAVEGATPPGWREVRSMPSMRSWASPCPADSPIRPFHHRSGAKSMCRSRSDGLAERSRPGRTTLPG